VEFEYFQQFSLLRACIQQYKHAYMVIYFMKYSIFPLNYAPKDSIIMHAEIDVPFAWFYETK